MPRGRHRHSQPLHRLLPPVAVSAVALACAGGSWLIGEGGIGDPATVTLRGLAAVAAVAAVVGSVQARRWDRVAGKRVGELKARMSSAEWRAEERQAELEGQLDDARELRGRLEGALRAKRTELTRLRSEHADLLRRYAEAESELAGALEGKRQLELEAAAAPKELTSAASDHRSAAGAPTALTYVRADEALRNLIPNVARQQATAAPRRPVPEPDASKPASAVVPERPTDAGGLVRGAQRARPLQRSQQPQSQQHQQFQRPGTARPSGGEAAASGTEQRPGDRPDPSGGRGPSGDEDPAGSFDFFGKGAPGAEHRDRRRPAVPTPRGGRSRSARSGTGQQDEADGDGGPADPEAAGGAADVDTSADWDEPADASASRERDGSAGTGDTARRAGTVDGTTGSSSATDAELDITELRSAI